MDKPDSKTTYHNGYRILVFLMLLATWFVFSGKFDWFHIALGVLSCGFVTLLSSDLLFQDRKYSVFRWIPLTFRILNYFFWLLWQIVLSNFHILKLAFSNRNALSPQIIRYDTELETDFEKFLLANSITLTPGTVTMKIMGQRFYIHAISEFAAQGLDGEMEKRIKKIFA